MLQIQKLTKSFGVETVLDSISFVVNGGDRVGLVGPNGSGKSTLLKILGGEIKADSGVVALMPGAALGYLPQGLPLDESLSAAEVIRSGIPGWQAALEDLETATSRLSQAENTEMQAALADYANSLQHFESLGGYAVEHRAEKVADGLGLEGLDRPVSAFSGGQRTRIGLAKVLIAQPDILLLDEPTNHLDIEALEWLETFLSGFSGAVLIVSHDRVFLDRTVNRIVALDEKTHGIREYTGSYSDYAVQAAGELARAWDQYRDQQAEIRRIEADIHDTKMQAKSVELTTTSRQPTVRRYAKKVAKKALSREKKLERYLDSDEILEKPKKGWEMKLAFDESLRSGQQVLHAKEIRFAYPGQEPVLSGVDLEAVYGDRIALLGRNGSGKSTLLKIIAGGLSPDSGRIRLGSSVRLGYMPQEQDSLAPGLTPLTIVQNARAMSDTEARNFLHFFLFEGDGALLPVEKLSYGERARLILARLVAAGSNFLVLDEPVNHLDIPSRERFEAALEAFPGTVLASVHDRAFIRNFAKRQVLLENGKLKKTD